MSRAPIQDLAAFRVPKGLRGRSVYIVLLWNFINATIFAASPQPTYGWRRFLLRCFGAEIGKDAIIRSSVKVTYPWRFSLGQNAWIGAHSCVSQGSHICTGPHDHRKPDFPYDCGPIAVEDQVWVAAKTFVGPRVRTGSGTVVGARSLVLKDLQSLSFYAGHPVSHRAPRI